jgi:choloylglycine hydrolase
MIIKTLRLIGVTALSAFLAINPIAASACTSFLLKATNDEVVTGRTLEFALPLNSQLIVIPRNLAIKAVGPDGNAGTGLRMLAQRMRLNPSPPTSLQLTF